MARMVACAPDFRVCQKLDRNDSWDGNVGILAWTAGKLCVRSDLGGKEQTDLNVHDNVGWMVVRLHLFSSNGRVSCQYSWDENGVLLGFHLLRFGLFDALIYQKPAR